MKRKNEKQVGQNYRSGVSLTINKEKPFQQAAPISRTETLRNDEARRHGMTNATKGFFPSPLAGEGGQRPGEGCMFGFTLIELLVVVLIIGILAAVALPQYQKAVEKSKAAQALTLLKSVYQSAKAYQLANDSWPTSFDELAVDIPWTGTEKWQNSNLPTKSNADWSIQLNTCDGKGVSVGRISGSFRGGAFGMFETPGASSGRDEVPSDEIVCVEGHANNSIPNVSSNVPGNYCKKLFKGTLINTAHANNYYKLP